MKQYRKLPVIIEAIQFTGLASVAEVINFCPDFDQINDPNSTMPEFGIPTLEGIMRADINDWIIKGIKGEFYPCKPDIFKSTYEEVN